MVAPPSESDVDSSPRRGRARGVVAIAGLSLFVFARCNSADDAPRFRTVEVERRDLVQTVEATGRLEARRLRVITASVRGRLSELLVAPRDVVRAGQVLGRVDARVFALEVRASEAQLAAARGRVAQARAEKTKAEQAFDRAQSLRAKDQASAAQLEAAAAARAQAEAGLDIAEAELARARSHLAAAQFALEQTAIKAPEDGVVLSVFGSLGGAVSPEGPVLFSLSDPLVDLALEAGVGEVDIGQLAIGQPCQFSVEAFPGRRFDATLERIGVVPELARGIASYPVTLSAKNPDGHLLPGMTAAVWFETGRAKGALAVREAALRFTPRDAPSAPPRSRVFKVVSGGLEAVEVEVGLRDGAYFEVRPRVQDSLRVGDAIALGYDRFVADEGAPGLSIGGKK